VPARARLELAHLLPQALASPLPRLEQISEFLALAITLRALGFDFVARLLIMSQRRLTGQPARYWSWPTSEGQFPFPLAPEFWGSWTNSWLETNPPRTVPTSREAALASNLFDVATQPKRRETVVINRSLACLSPVPSTFSLTSPPFGASTPNRQPGAGWSPLGRQPNAGLGWEHAAQ
jgi:hypothetical protein